ncbi:MAG: cation diffusion facilitator family transporter [Candidatus Kryptonium sp.]|nr:cation diffusion facilitator family transporter [Candidatus Kryptonium sp.]MCX7762386.1 cation diffusion facilitator family transporter [Candidatus Kryptonium sp.]MDW8109825.1 cation diffusion facilitator family transporter [Candidatus Kryptonium sp.]
MNEKFTQKLKFVLVILIVFFVVELTAGFLTNSLALISDAGHMVTDIFAIVVSLLGFKIAVSRSTKNKTYGFYRAEIIAAFINGILLILISGYILIEAFERLKNPPVVKGLEMLLVATAGLIANIIASAILFSERRKNLNMRAAYLHVLSDALGSIGAISAGIVIILTKWFYADILASFLISAIIAYNSIRLLKDSINILMEGVPSDVDIDKIANELLKIPEVIAVHDLHIWTLASGKNILTAHVRVKGEIDRKKLNALLNEIETTIKESSNIEHTTIQIESATFDAEFIIPDIKEKTANKLNQN